MRSLNWMVLALAGLYELLELLAIFIIVFAIVIGTPLAIAVVIKWALSS